MKTNRPLSTRPIHTIAQRRRMFALARYLDKLPTIKLNMSQWQMRSGESTLYLTADELANECGTAACGCGHAVMIPCIRRITTSPSEVTAMAFGMTYILDRNAFDPSYRLFGPHRTCTPKRLARDIRDYLRDGTLPD